MGLSNVLREGISKWGTPSALLFHIRQCTYATQACSALMATWKSNIYCYKHVVTRFVSMCMCGLNQSAFSSSLLFSIAPLSLSIFGRVGLYHKLTLGPLAASVIWIYMTSSSSCILFVFVKHDKNDKAWSPSRGLQDGRMGPISSFVCNDLQI